MEQDYVWLSVLLLSGPDVQLHGLDVLHPQPSDNTDVARAAEPFLQPLIQNFLSILKIPEGPRNRFTKNNIQTLKEFLVTYY